MKADRLVGSVGLPEVGPLLVVFLLAQDEHQPLHHVQALRLHFIRHSPAGHMVSGWSTDL